MGPRLRGDERFALTDSIVKQRGHASSPLFFAARGRRLAIPSSSQTPRGWSAERRTSLPSCRAPSSGARAPLGAPRRRFLIPRSAFPGFRSVFFSALAPVRLIGLSRAGRSENLTSGPSPAGSLRRGRSAPRSVPGTSRARGNEPRARAPHQPAAVSRGRSERRCPFSGTSPLDGSIIGTSRDDALSRARRERGCEGNVAEVWNLFL